MNPMKIYFLVRINVVTGGSEQEGKRRWLIILKEGKEGFTIEELAMWKDLEGTGIGFVLNIPYRLLEYPRFIYV